MVRIGKRRVRRGAAEWGEIVRRFEGSGVRPLQVFCEREGVTRSSFQRWRRRLRNTKVLARQPEFVELVAGPPRHLPQGWACEIAFADGTTLRLRG